MNNFQSIQTTTGLPRTATTTVAATVATPTAATLSATAFVERDSMATCHTSRGWTIPVTRKSSNKTSEGDSNSLAGLYNGGQDTEIEVTSAISV